ncbi:MAG: ABC transporter permease [Clostridiaceae bacterium]|nr:ABC transporter permease [Clostridiaceae bacterium]
MSNKDTNIVQEESRKFFKDASFWRLAIILVALIIIFTVYNPEGFMSIANFQSMSYQLPEFGLMAYGVMLTMIAGGIDLAVVGMANLSAIISAIVMLRLAESVSEPVAIIVAVLVGLLVGTLCGAFNGLLVSRLNVPAMLATLGSHQLFTGIGLVITQGSGISRLPAGYSTTGRMLILDLIPISVIIFIIITAALAFQLNKTKFGQELYLVGSNYEAAKFSGINNYNVLTRAHTMSGLLSAVAGLIMLANYNSAKPDYGTAYTMQTILIVVLGGVSPAGGFGKIGGIVLSILILQVSSSGLNMFSSISNFYRQLIWGLVLLLVLGFNFLRNYMNEKRIAKAGKTAAETETE